MAPLAVTLPVELSAADRARVDQALLDSRAGNTRAQYRSAWRGWAEWSALNGHATLPADPLAIAAYLADRSAQGAAAATVRTIRAAIRAGHVDTGADDPTGHDGVRRVLQGINRQTAGRGRGQADPLTADDVADGRGIVVYVRRSKTDQDGTAADVRYLKNGCAAALRQLRDRLTVQRSGLRPDGTAQVLGGINGQSIARRLTAAASAAGIEGRITGHSGRVGLAVELTRRGAPEQATAKAGGWKSSRMVAHYAAAVAAEQGAVATYL